MRTALILAVSLMALTSPAVARTGILICQMGVTEFADDAARNKDRLSVNQMAAVRQLVDVSRSQCRWGPDIVDANIMSMRGAFAIGSGPQSAERFDEFWPASREELSAMTK